MTTPRPALRAIGVIIGILLIVSPAFAEVVVDETFEEYEDTSGESVYGKPQLNTEPAKYSSFYFVDINEANWLNYVVIDTYSISGYGNPKQGRWIDTDEEIAPGRYDFTYTLGSGESARTGPGVLYLSQDINALNQVTATHFTLLLNEWNITGLSGSRPVYLPFYYAELGTRPESGTTINGNIYHPGASSRFPVLGLRYTYSTADRWVSRLVVTTDESNDYNIDLFRKINGLPSRTKMEIFDKNDEKTYTSDRTGIDESVWMLKDLCQKITLTSTTGNMYNISMTGDPGPTDSAPVTVYVQNSQTGALLANAHLSILAAAGGTEVEIINATLPGGTGTYTLQPTGGGPPNPDYYRAVATVPGFSQIIENHSFTLSGPHDVIIEMRPDSGGPTDPERCYLEFYVRDLNANPIPSASVQCDNRILQTNSAGYAVFEVAKNASHPWIAKKSGYVTIEGTATVADGPRYVVNVVLGPGSIPTYTPTGGATPTPTATPTGWGPGQWTPDPGASIGDNARSAAKQTLLEGLQVGQLLFMLTMLMLIMAVLNSRRR